MPDTIFRGLFDTDMTTVIAPWQFLLCVGAALALGLVIALSYMYRTRYTRSFVVTLAMLPAVVCVVIMMVNGNVGAGVAVAGAFSLVRFRSVPGTAREIGTIFLAMGAGLVCGMGYLAYAALFTLVLCAVFMLYSRLDLGTKKNAATYKVLNITVPEDLDYTGAFDDVFHAYTEKIELTAAKTANMGSLYKLTYRVVLKPTVSEKRFLDDLRVRNGNLEILLARAEENEKDL